MGFIETAYKGKNDWWMYFLGIIIVFAGTQLGSLPLGLVAFFQAGGDSAIYLEAAKDDFMKMGINSNLFLFLMIFTFMMGLFALFLTVKYIHKKKFKWIVTSRNFIDWKRVYFGFFSWGIISSVIILVGIYLEPELYVWNFQPVPFFVLLAISLLFLPFQTSAEEVFFRGYFMQGLGLLSKNRWFPLFMTSVIFGLLHMANPEIDKIGNIALVFYIGTGLFFGIATLMDDGLELALGLHASNNIVAAFLVTTDWTVFQTDALFVDKTEPSVSLLMFVPVFVLYPLMLLWFSKKYKWNNWKEKLFGNVEQPEFITKNEIS
tara:strand:- start:2412 stop:3368 length:957 start_codon:yes stop_codon:yes gene_type:complete